MAPMRNIAIATLVVGAATLGCKAVDPPRRTFLHLVATFPMTITEPSGLALNDSGTVMWTVTNNPGRRNRVYQLDMHGNVVRTLDYDGEDLEGIEYDASDRTLWVVEELRREVVHLDLNGRVLSRRRLGLTGEPNKGLEGVCVNGQGRVCVLNEKSPGLFIELNPDLTIASQQTLSFAGDYAGLDYDRTRACFWIVSDESRRLYQWTKANGVLSAYDLPFDKAEGVAYDEATDTMYIVSDSEHRLYVYKFAQR